jgi:ribosomal protein L44E
VLIDFRGWTAEDRGQRTEDRGQRTESKGKHHNIHKGSACKSAKVSEVRAGSRKQADVQAGRGANSRQRISRKKRCKQQAKVQTAGNRGEQRAENREKRGVAYLDS